MRDEDDPSSALVTEALGEQLLPPLAHGPTLARFDPAHEAVARGTAISPGGPGGNPGQPRLLQPAGLRACQPNAAACSRAQPPRRQDPLLHRRSVPRPGGATGRRVPDLRSASHLRPLPAPVQLPSGGRRARSSCRGSHALLHRRASTRAPGGRDQRRDVPVGAPGSPCHRDPGRFIAERVTDRPQPASGAHHTGPVRASGERRGTGLPPLSARRTAAAPDLSRRGGRTL